MSVVALVVLSLNRAISCVIDIYIHIGGHHGQTALINNNGVSTHLCYRI